MRALLCTALLLLAPAAARAQATADAPRAAPPASTPPASAAPATTPPATSAPPSAAPAAPPTTPPSSPPPAGAPSSPPAGAPSASGAAQGQPQPPDDFDLLPKEKPPDAAELARAAEIERKASLRRNMLQLHQLGGFVTLGALSATVIAGQLNYNDKYGGGGDTGRYRTFHSVAAYSSVAIFAATGLLAVFAPNPTEKKTRLDTATVHKILLAIATAAMASEVVLGPLTGSAEGTLRQRDLALAHQIIGYTALASTAAGFFVLTF